MEERRNASLNLLNKSMAVAELILERKSITDYGRRLRGLVRGLWNGEIDIFTFVDSVRDALMRAFEQAWTEGARAEGIEPSERSPDEQRRLDEMIFEQSGYIPGLADYVNSKLKADGFLLRDAQARIPMWINRYREVKTEAGLMAAADVKKLWVLGPTKVHCSSCLKMAGKVKRASQWLAAGVQPRSRSLACGGFRCLCELVTTDLPLSKGPLPRLP